MRYILSTLLMLFILSLIVPVYGIYPSDIKVVIKQDDKITQPFDVFLPIIYNISFPVEHENRNHIIIEFGPDFYHPEQRTNPEIIEIPRENIRSESGENYAFYEYTINPLKFQMNFPGSEFANWTQGLSLGSDSTNTGTWNRVWYNVTADPRFDNHPASLLGHGPTFYGPFTLVTDETTTDETTTDDTTTDDTTTDDTTTDDTTVPINESSSFHVVLYLPDDGEECYIRSKENTDPINFDYILLNSSYKELDPEEVRLIRDCCLYIYDNNSIINDPNCEPINGSPNRMSYKFAQENTYSWKIMCTNICGKQINSTDRIIDIKKDTINTTTYVDQDDPDPDSYIYSSIQEAIEHVEYDGTVIVYEGDYKGSLVINKPIKLIAKEKESTIIRADENYVIKIQENNVYISNFTISGGNTGVILESCSGCILEHNSIIGSSIIGINLKDCSKCYIEHNKLESTGAVGIGLDVSNQCELISNNIYDIKGYCGEMGKGISIYNGYENNIHKNDIYNAHIGIKLMEGCVKNVVSDSNKFRQINSCDILIYGCDENGGNICPTRCSGTDCKQC